MRRLRADYEYFGDIIKLMFRSGKNKRGSVEFDGTSVTTKINDITVLDVASDGADITGTLAVSGATAFTGAITTDTINETTSANGVVVDGVLIKDGQLLNNTFGFPLYHGIDPASWITYFNDFVTVPLDDTTGFPTEWVMVTDAGGTTGDEVDQAGGWLRIGSTNTDNNETYLSSLGESLIFSTNKKMIFKCRIQLTEANTNDANWVIGVSDTVGADFLQDDGAGPAASYDGAVFFKVDGTMKVQFESSNAAAQVTNATLADFVSGTAVTLAFIYDYGNGTTGTVTPYVNGTAGTAQNITIAGLQEMHIVMGVKSGDTNAENFLVDYIAIAQER